MVFFIFCYLHQRQAEFVANERINTFLHIGFQWGQKKRGKNDAKGYILQLLLIF